MRKSASAAIGRRLRAGAAILVLLGLPALLAACSATGGGVKGLFAAADNRPDDVSPDYFLRPAYCPPVRIRGGTETFTIYERGQEAESSAVRYQASIRKTARECRKTVEGFAVKVGIAGRAVAGPKGGPGTFTLPIRVVLTQQSGGVVASQLFQVPVTIVSPALGGDFSQVVEDIPVSAGPHERDFIIYVGFDEGTTG